MIYTTDQLNKLYDGITGRAIAHCRFTRNMIGGMPADEKGIRTFLTVQAKIPEGEALDQAVKRVMGEEVLTSQPGDELNEVETYGVKVVRKDADGRPWLGDWMLKACLKNAFSRTGLYVSKKGAKGDTAEMGRVVAVDASLLDPTNPHKIYIVDDDGAPAQTHYEQFRGRVSTPLGPKSIVSDVEAIDAGARFCFQFRWYNGKLGEKDIATVFAAAQVIGVGSARAYESGKFTVEHLDIEV